MSLLLVLSLLLSEPPPGPPPELASLKNPVVTAYLAGVTKNRPPNGVYLHGYLVHDSCVLPEPLARQALSLLTDSATYSNAGVSPYGYHCALMFEEEGRTVYVFLGLHNYRARIVDTEPGKERLLSSSGALALLSLFEEVFPGLEARFPGERYP